MASSAHLVTIKRSGDDGAHFPLSLSSCLFGRSIECDIRIQLPVVSKRHCKIEVKEQEAILYNFSSTNPTQVNGVTIDEPVRLRHGDIITIIDRSFRYEDGNHEDGSKSTEFPGKSLGKEPSRRASRDSFCADPDGEGQDTKASKMTASRRSFVHAKGLSADSPASDGSKNSVSQDSSGHVEQHTGRNIVEPTSGDLFKKSRSTGSSYREPKSSPTQSLSNSNEKESPFEKLYQSMKEELDVKSQKSCRKSEPQPDRAAEESRETQLLVSGKARAKSSGSTPVTAASSPKVGKIWTERWRGGMVPVQTSTETAKMKTPVRHSQQLKDEDSRVTGRQHSVNLDEGESAQAVHKTVTPGKLATKNQAVVEAGDVASPADTPEHSSSKKRSIPAKVEAPSAETQKRLSLTQRLVPGEKKTPKGSFSKPEKLATAAEQTCSGLPGLSSVDISNFGDSINKSEGMPMKRRRVSFGGHLRPELFDENLPPNTPLKRGETPTKRKSLGTHSPAVLKTIIKERPQSPGKQESPGITPPRTNDQRRRSGRTSSGSKFLCETDIPKKAGRKSGNLPAKRASISRSQHGILQMICSKRRSGASEANLIVAKSWADVVKLGVKQTQTKVAKHVPQKQTSKRQRRPSTPKKPTSNLHNQFTTGHANSPCTIVVGRAQIEKVSVPARPYKMLNNLMLNRKVDFSEDLSGLTEMFKTPVKEKQQQMSDTGSVLSNSANLSERQLQVTNSGDIPEPITTEILGEKVLSSTRNAAKQQSDRYSASPTLRRRSIKHENTVQTPKNVHNITDLEKKTPVSETEPLKTASSVSKLRRSRELRHTLVETMNEKTEAVLAENTTARHLRGTFREQKVDQQVQDNENAPQRCKESGELSEGSEKTSARRSSARKQKPTKDLLGSQMVTQTADYAEELLSQGQGTIQNLEESMHMQNTSISEDQGITEKKVNIMVYATKEKHSPKTPGKKAQPLEGPAGLKEHFETPNPKDKPITEDRTRVLCKSPQVTTENITTNTKPQTSTSGKKVDMKEESSALTKRIHMPGESRHNPKILKLECEDIKALKQSENEMLTSTVNGSKRTLEKSKKKAQPLEDLTGFQELFISPVPTNIIKKMPSKSPHTQPVRTPASTKRLSKTGLSKVDVREDPSTLGKRTKSPGRAPGTPAPVQEENDSTAFMETPKQKLDFAGNSSGSKRRSRTSKNRSQPLEDLDGFQELFQTPAGASNPVSVEESAKISLESSQAEPVRTRASTKRLSKTGLNKMDVREGHSPLSKSSCASQKVMQTLTLGEDHGRETKDGKVLSAQKLEPAIYVTRGKRQQRSCKKRSQSPEDLSGVQEVFQTSGHNKDSVTVDNLAKLPSSSPPLEPTDTSVTSRRQARTGLRKVHVKNELSGGIMHPQISGEIVDLPREPEGEGKVIKTRKQSVKRKLDTEVNVPRSKRQRITRAEKTLEDLPGFQELCQAPSLVMDSVIVEKTTKMPDKSPEPVDTTSETQARRRLRRLVVTEEPIPQRKTTRVVRQTRNTQKEPISDNQGMEEFKESSVQKQDPSVSLTGRRNQPRTVKEKTQPLEELTSFQEETAKRISSKSPQPEEKETLAGLKRQLRIQLINDGVKEEPTAQRKQPSRETRNTLKEPVGDSINVEEVKKSTKQKIDPVASVPVTKRPRRVPKEKAQALELAGLKGPIQTLGHTDESASDKGPTQMPCNSLQPEQVDSFQSSPRRPRTRRGKVEADEEPSAVRKTVSTSRQTMRSRKVPEIGNNGTQVSKASIKQTLDTVAKVTGSRRQLRTHKDGVQPLEVLGDSKEITQISDHSEKLAHDTSILKSTQQQKPDSVKPLRTCRRVLRASKEDPKEVLVDTRDHATLQSKSNPLLSPKRKSARDGSIVRTRALRSLAPKQEATDEKPVPEKKRAASSKRHVSPEPVKMKHLKIVSNKLESVEEQVSTVMKTEEMEAKRENPVTPDQNSRYRKKTNVKQPRPKFDASAENVGIKKNEKTMKTASQETELQNPDDGAKKSTSRGQVSGKRTCLRSRGTTEMPQPCEAEEKTSKPAAEILIKPQEEKGVSGESDVRCLRSRKTRVALDSEPKPRVTRGTKKDAKTLKEDEDIVCTKKLRTRS